MKILSNILLKAGIIVDNYVAIGTNSPFAGYNIDSRGSHNFGNTSTEVYHYFQSSSVNGGSALSVYANNTSANSARSQIMLADTAASVPTRFGLGVYTGATPYAYLDSASKLVINNASGANVIIGGITDSGHKLNVIGTTRLGGNVTMGDNANLVTTNQFYAVSTNYVNSIFVGWDVSAVYLGYGFGSLPIHIGTNGSGEVRFRNTGGFKIDSLAGTGSRMVVTDSSGVLSTQAIPTGNAGTVTSVALATGTTGTDINVSGSPVTSSGTLTLNIPDASASARGVITTGTQTISGQKTFRSLTTIFDSTEGATFIEGKASGVLYGGMSFSLFMQFNAYAAATGGYLWKNGAGNNVMALSQAGALTVANLAGSGDRMVVADAYGVLSTQAIPSGGGASASTRTIQKFTTTSNQTTFTVTGGYTVGMVDVFVNGVKIDNATDFTATNGSTVVLTDALASGQTVEVYKYGSQFIVNNGLRQTTLFSATAGQTTFTVNYSVNMVDVFYNGSKLDSSEYTATNGTSIVFNTACNVNDKVEVIAYTYNVGAFTGVGGSGTTNYIPKWTASGTLGNSLIQDNGSVVSIGMATDTSYGELNIKSNSTITYAGLNVFANSNDRFIAVNHTGTVGIIEVNNAGSTVMTPLAFRVNGDERMRIATNGYIGINASSPQSILHAVQTNTTAPTSGTTPSGYALSYGGGDGNNGGLWFSTDFGGDQGIAGIAGTRVSGYQTDLRFYTNNANSARAFTERMRIRPNGNVTIGAVSGNSAVLDIKPGVATSDGVILSATYTGSGSYGSLIFHTSDTERIRILAGGNLLLRRTTKASPDYTLVIQGGTGDYLTQWYSANGTYTTDNFLDSGNGSFWIRNGASEVYLNRAGQNWQLNSDAYLKKNKRIIDNALVKIKQINGYYYNPITSESEVRVGLIAQEVQSILPEVVSSSYSKTHSRELLGLSYGDLVPLLVNGLQEEDAKVNAQELRIQQLEQEVITLKSQLGSN